MVLTNIPNHYRIPFFNEVNRQLKQDGMRLVVVFAAKTYERRKRAGREPKLEDSRFEYVILPSILLGTRRQIFLPRKLKDVIHKEMPSVLIVAGTGTLGLAAAWWASKVSIPLIIWSGEIRRGPKWIFLAKRSLKRYLLKRASAAIAYGTRSAELLRNLHEETQIFIAWNTTDLDRFLSVKPKALRENQDRTVEILTVGDLVPIKGYEYLLQAMASLGPRQRQAAHLQIVGTGPNKTALGELADNLGLNVTFHGNKAADQIPEFLASGDFFVFPSLGDVWGLALLESMAAGLPVVASCRAGATADLVTEETGLRVDPLDVDSFAATLTHMIDMPTSTRYEMGMRAKRHVSRLCRLDRSAGAFVEASRYAMAGAK